MIYFRILIFVVLSIFLVPFSIIGVIIRLCYDAGVGGYEWADKKLQRHCSLLILDIQLLESKVRLWRRRL